MIPLKVSLEQVANVSMGEFTQQCSPCQSAIKNRAKSIQTDV